jgi:hypothetical protein
MSTSLLFSEEEWITIFIHGTIGLRANLALSTIIKLLQNDISNSAYKKTVELIRDDPIFYKNQPIQHRGLHPINIFDNTPGNAASLCARLFDRVTDSAKKEKNTYYTFGWSGLISPGVRYDSARDLHTSIATLLQQYATKSSTPKIRLVCYSHGGNAALYLGALRDTEFPHETFIIDEMILLGVPVQKETDYLICHQLFKKIYHIYSRHDRVQRMDFFSFKRFFSQRRFYTCSRYTLPDHLVQIEIQCYTYPRYSTEKKVQINRSPGHSELWFFGWPEHKKSSYRKHFPLHPLPIACLTPALLQVITTTHPQEKNLVLELHPHTGKTFLRTRHVFKKQEIHCFSDNFIDELRATARQHRPSNYTAELQKEHMHNAVQLAYESLNNVHAEIEPID